MRELEDPGTRPSKSVPWPAWVCTGLLLVAAGCGAAEGQFFIVHNQVPSEGCVIPVDKAAPYQGEGVLDVAVPMTNPEAAYLLFPLLENDLPADAEGVSSPNRIALTGFEIDLTAIGGPDAFRSFFDSAVGDPERAGLVRYQVPWSGSVDPGGGTTSATTNALPAEAARRLRDTGALAGGSIGLVNARVRAVGRTSSATLRSDAFNYPIRVCQGCLIRRTSACPLAAPIASGGICNAGQDATIDCCTVGATLVCPATVAP